jgi:hypothetical protein
MKLTRILTNLAMAVLLLFATGCFRVSSETRALRDVGLEFAGTGAEEKIEFGAGFFTVGLAKLGTRFVDMPDEVKTILGSAKGVECSVYRVRGRQHKFAEVLCRADEAMDKQDAERVVGVINGEQLIAVYVPRSADDIRNMSMSVLVLTKRDLICATARGDLDAVIELAYAKAEEKFSPKREVAARF